MSNNIYTIISEYVRSRDKLAILRFVDLLQNNIKEHGRTEFTNKVEELLTDYLLSPRYDRYAETRFKGKLIEEFTKTTRQHFYPDLSKSDKPEHL
jgi:hypothetical protein